MAPELHCHYLPVATTPGDARRDVATYLMPWALDGLTPVATLVVSELVTNALVHAPGPIGLRAAIRGDVLHIAVEDTGIGVPRCREPDEHGGRGLQIVAALALDWGINLLEDGRGGKATWAQLPLTPSPPSC
jgi:two-component sensor histidine kinase